MTSKRKRAGHHAVKAMMDSTKYDLLELGHALTDDVLGQLRICAERHEKHIDEDEYCVILLVAGDPLIKNLRRHKYYAWPYLPQPRPQQSVFLYNKQTKKLRRLWSLPDAKVMACISEMKWVDKHWIQTKMWCDSFFRHTFFTDIRKTANISLLSESEYLEAHREELIKAGCKQLDSSFSDPFDFSKVSIEKIVDTKTAVSD